MTTNYTFPDGGRVSLLHRYGIKLELQDRFVEIGFEQALEPGVDRLIHATSIAVWHTPKGEVGVSDHDRSMILDRVIQYCAAKGLTYRIVGE